MGAPALIVRLSIEHPPSVYVDCLSDSEESRLWFWLGSKPEILELVARAIEIADEARAA
jgi:hypothetical protein